MSRRASPAFAAPGPIVRDMTAPIAALVRAGRDTLAAFEGFREAGLLRPAQVRALIAIEQSLVPFAALDPSPQDGERRPGPGACEEAPLSVPAAAFRDAADRARRTLQGPGH